MTSIGEYAFEGCSGLTSVHISDIAAWCNIDFGYHTNPLTYAHHLFLNGEEIKDLLIPNSVTNIAHDAFNGCRGLTSVTIPNSVTSIGSNAFLGCSGLNSVTFGNSVTRISYSAFSGCSSLTSITIPNNVTIIDNSAFENCIGLKSFTCLNPVPPTCSYGSPFKGIDLTIPLYIPVGSVLKYKAANGWRDFVIFREISDEAEDVVLSINDGGNGATQLLVDEAKPYFTLIFKADEGWKLHSVTLNGDNVTYEVGEDGKYTTPPLTVSSSIKVVYEQSSSQGINATYGTPIQVRGGNGEVIISRNSSEITAVTVYQIDGKQILQQPLSDIETHISLPEGHVYIIKAGKQQYKVEL